jgi:paraquat-inducible protein A
MFVACESCDLLHRGIELARGCRALCSRCGERLYGSPIDSLERTLAFTIAAAVLLVLANAYPFLKFSLGGQVQENRIVTGILDLYQSGFQPLAALILLTTVVAPFLEIFLHLWAIIPVLLGFRFPGVEFAARASTKMAGWSFLEVYLLAVIVAVVKLAMMATVNLEMGAYAFFALIAVLTAARSSLEVDFLWSRIEARR